MTEYERRVELSIDHIFRLQGRPYEPHQSKAVDDIRDAVLIGMTGKSPHDAVADRTLSTTSGEEAVASGICSYSIRPSARTRLICDLWPHLRPTPPPSNR